VLNAAHFMKNDVRPVSGLWIADLRTRTWHTTHHHHHNLSTQLFQS